MKVDSASVSWLTGSGKKLYFYFKDTKQKSGMFTATLVLKSGKQREDKISNTAALFKERRIGSVGFEALIKTVLKRSLSVVLIIRTFISEGF